MISKQAFAGIITFLVVIGLGYNVFHFVEHKVSLNIPMLQKTDAVDTTDLENAKDVHTHKYYWHGIGDGKLVKVYDKSYGEPKPDVTHRHTGSDYVQAGLVTWKHVHDQHLPKK